MRNLVDTLNESKTSPREIRDYIHSWLYSCRDTKELKVFFNSIIAGLNDGLEDMTMYGEDNIELCETASEIIEQLEVICKNTLK